MRSDALNFKQYLVVMLVCCLGMGLHLAGCGPSSTMRDVPASPPEEQPEAAANDESMQEPDRELNSDLMDSNFDPPMPSDASATTWGYRVQIYSFSARDAADAAVKRVKQFMADWPHGVYLDEEEGLFKVRVGDFTDKADADRLRDRLRMEGYDDAWTASVQISAP